MAKTEKDIARLKVLQEKDAAHSKDNSKPALSSAEQTEFSALAN